MSTVEHQLTEPDSGTGSLRSNQASGRSCSLGQPNLLGAGSETTRFKTGRSVHHPFLTLPFHFPDLCTFLVMPMADFVHGWPGGHGGQRSENNKSTECEVLPLFFSVSSSHHFPFWQAERALQDLSFSTSESFSGSWWDHGSDVQPCRNALDPRLALSFNGTDGGSTCGLPQTLLWHNSGPLSKGVADPNPWVTS